MALTTFSTVHGFQNPLSTDAEPPIALHKENNHLCDTVVSILSAAILQTVREFPGFQSQITISSMEDRMVQKNILADSLSFFRKQFIVIDPVRTRYRFHEEDLAFRERSSSIELIIQFILLHFNAFEFVSFFSFSFASDASKFLEYKKTAQKESGQD